MEQTQVTVQNRPNTGVTVLIVVIMVLGILIAVGYLLGYLYKKNKPPREVRPFRFELDSQALSDENIDVLSQ